MSLNYVSKIKSLMQSHFYMQLQFVEIVIPAI